MKCFRPSLVRRLIGNSAVAILEIGANDGEDSEEFLRTFTHRDFRLYCFECDPRAIARWSNRIRHPRATLIPAAVAERSGTFSFHPSGGQAPGARWRPYGEWDKSGSLLAVDRHTDHTPWLRFGDPIAVPVTTLDEWTEQNIPGKIIDFCWVDVQGAEHLVLLGGLKTLRRIRYWYCECDPRPNYRGQATIDDLKQIMATNGFEFQSEHGEYNFLWKNTSLDVAGNVLAPFTVDNAASMPMQPRAAPMPIQPRQAPTRPPVEPIAPVRVDTKPKIVKTKFMGQFGNQLFQYVAGKIMADVTGLAFMPPPCFLTKKGSPVSWTESPLFVMRPTPIENYDKDGPDMSYTGEQWIDWRKYRDAGSVALQGYFQRYECLKPWKDKIKQEWLKFETPLIDCDQDAIHVHCRRTDYIPGVDNPNRPECHGISTTIGEYAKCLKVFPDAKRLLIHTDDPKDPWLREFDKLGLPWSINQARWDEDFLSLASCRWMIMSQSTFSWWAAFLGRAEKIVCPLSKGTLWHCGKDLYGPPGRRDYPNLRVDDEPGRWTWVEM